MAPSRWGASSQGAHGGAGAHRPPPALPRLQKEIEVLENAGPLTTAAGEGAAAPSPAKDEKTEVALDSRQVRR